MADFNALIEGYRRFREKGWAHAARALGGARRGPEPEGDGDRLLGQPGRPGPDFRRPARRDVRRPQRRQPRPAVRAATTHYHGVSAALEFARDPARGRGAGGDGPRLLRRLRGGADRPVRRRRARRRPLHRPLDRHAARRPRRDPRPPPDARPPGLPRDGAGGRAHLAAQPAHLPLGARARGGRPAQAARRLFRHRRRHPPRLQRASGEFAPA